jgi:hypothetical protein
MARFYHNEVPNTLALESQLYNLVGPELKAMGHNVSPTNGAPLGGIRQSCSHVTLRLLIQKGVLACLRVVARTCLGMIGPSMVSTEPGQTTGTMADQSAGRLSTPL